MDTTPKPTRPWRLWLAVGLPLVFLLIALAVLYIPQMSVKTAYDFIYTNDPNSWTVSLNETRSLEVSNQHQLVVGVTKDGVPAGEIGPITKTSQTPTIYYHDTQKNVSRSLTFDEAGGLEILKGELSPDGFVITIESGSTAMIDLFSSSSMPRPTLIKGLYRQVMNTVNNNQYYGGNFHVFGWVKRP